MADLFRKSSLEKLSNPEQLDRAITISSPMSWLALVGVFLIIVATGVWSVFGTLPTTLTVEGMIVSPISTCAVYSECSGTIEEVFVEIGDFISVDTEIAQIKQSDGSTIIIKATQSGVVSEILVTSQKDISSDIVQQQVATQVYPGSEIVRYTPDTEASQMVICYVPVTIAKQLKQDMKVLIFPSSINTQKYGHMEAVIKNIGEYPVAVSNMVYVLGDMDNSVINQFAANGPVISIVCEIKRDSSAKNGFAWSNKDGGNLMISNGTYVLARIITDECAPISKLITNLKDKLEG